MFDIDPIIKSYENMKSQSQDSTELPEYSEIFLRLSFLEVFGKAYAIKHDILNLYKKILVLYYSEQYPSIASVQEIMDKCFSRCEIANIIADKDILYNLWQQFVKTDIVNLGTFNEKRKICEEMHHPNAIKRNRIE
ncbi:uncharacterized protein [Musca autumnalis]|uniref:uncharacterized protein n=1 Tax=Musca autumnalis TaxID=221902 RepID=UPI003CE8DD9C